MASITKDTTNHVWNFTDTLSSDTYNVVFDTQNKFLDAKIKASLTVDSGAITPIFDSANSGLLTYFTDDGTAADNSVHITPQATNTAGFIALHNNSSPVIGTTAYYKIKPGEGQANTANVVLYTTDGSNAGENISSIVGTVSDTEPNTSGTYYLAFTGSGSSKIKTTGWFTQGTTLTAASKTRYFPITKAVLAVSKTGGSITPTADLSQSNVSWSDTNTSGISVTATGNGSVSNLSIKANVSTAGYIPSGDVATASSLSIAAAGTAATKTKYITGVTVASGKSFAVTNSGTTTVTAGISGSTTQGIINIVAYPSSGTTAESSQKIVDGGRWVTNTVGAGSSTYTTKYGKTIVNYGAASSSHTISNTTYITTTGASSSSYDLYITPRHTIGTAGYLAAASNVNGTAVYYKVVKTSISQNNTTVTTTDSSNNPTAVSRGTASWGDGWVSSGSISAATFANTASANTTYIDISYTTDAPVLTSGDYLYINKGYVDNLKISLAKLVPDTITGKTMAPANYILTGYAAFDGAGAAINGTMQIYNGAFTVS